MKHILMLIVLVVSANIASFGQSSNAKDYDVLFSRINSEVTVWMIQRSSIRRVDEKHYAFWAAVFNKSMVHPKYINMEVNCKTRTIKGNYSWGIIKTNGYTRNYDYNFPNARQWIHETKLNEEYKNYIFYICGIE